MKRTDISEIFPDATKEQIDKLLGINGNDINSAKGELDTLKGQLSTAQAELQQLKENGGQPDALKEAQKAITSLQAELTSMKQKEALRTMREKVSEDKKIPAALLTGETEDDCAKQADAILAFAATKDYPIVPDAGEAHGGKGPSTRDKFAAWAEKNL